MSNENSTTNEPLKSKKKFKVSSSYRVRKFCCISYLNENQLKVCLQAHNKQIRCYAYALHDKDVDSNGELKEPHFHIIIITYTTCTLSAVKKWFRGFVDCNGDINTFVEKCLDDIVQYDYLTHRTAESIAQGKYVYDYSIIHTNSPEYFNAQLCYQYDTVTLASNMLLEGKPVREVGQIFGRDFILHYTSIKRYITDIYLQENSSCDNLSALIEYDLNKR